MLNYIKIDEGQFIAFLYQRFFVELKLALKLDFFFFNLRLKKATHINVTLILFYSQCYL